MYHYILTRMFVICVGIDGCFINAALNISASHTVTLVVNKESLTSQEEQTLPLLRAKMDTSLWYVQYLLVSFLGIIDNNLLYLHLNNNFNSLMAEMKWL
jgi:hypothetical protein